MAQADTSFDEWERGETEPSLVIDVDGFEGPLDLLLELARRQKIDLFRISISALATQYLAFIEEARRLRLELAADYLVMAAWLTYLKSRLLLPPPTRPDEPEPIDLADILARRLRRLDAIRRAARLLMERDQIGRDVHDRGREAATTDDTGVWAASLHDLVRAYALQRSRTIAEPVQVMRREAWSLIDAREALERLFGALPGDWTDLDQLILSFVAEPAMRRTVRASSFSAVLELAREGRIDLRQERTFAPLLLRPRTAS